MPIEIKELVIRATVEEPERHNREAPPETCTREKQECSSDTLDLLLQLMKESKER
jgi:hypothetical protein